MPSRFHFPLIKACAGVACCNTLCYDIPVYLATTFVFCYDIVGYKPSCHPIRPCYYVVMKFTTNWYTWYHCLVDTRQGHQAHSAHWRKIVKNLWDSCKQCEKKSLVGLNSSKLPSKWLVSQASFMKGMACEVSKCLKWAERLDIHTCKTLSSSLWFWSISISLQIPQVFIRACLPDPLAVVCLCMH